MSFWSTNEGEDLKKEATGQFDGGGGDFEPIPNNTQALACIEQIGWVSNTEEINGRKVQIDDTRHVQAVWSILAPDEIAGRKVTQNLWVGDDDPRAATFDKALAKRVKAKKMLLAIDSNAGGKLMSKDEEPTDARLQSCLANKPMVIMIMQMAPDDPNQRSLNWVRAVAPKVSKNDLPPVPKDTTPPKARQQQSRGRADDDDGDLPF